MYMYVDIIVCDTLMSEICVYHFVFLCTSLFEYVYPIMCFSTARERIIGWYHSGPKLHHNDIAIHELIGKYCQNPVSQYCGVFFVKVGS